MYCPNCKREVGGKKVADSNAIFWIVVSAVCITLALTGIGIVIALPTFIAAIFFTAHGNAPIECPICRTRLLGKGEKRPFYESREQAEGKGFCRACNRSNAVDAVFCSQCGGRL